MTRISPTLWHSIQGGAVLLTAHRDARPVVFIALVNYGLVRRGAQFFFICVPRIIAVAAYDLRACLNPDQPFALAAVPGKLDFVCLHTSKISNFAQVWRARFHQPLSTRVFMSE